MSVSNSAGKESSAVFSMVTLEAEAAAPGLEVDRDVMPLVLPLAAA